MRYILSKSTVHARQLEEIQLIVGDYEILSKSNIVGKIAPLNPTFEKTDQKKETKIEPIE